MSGRFITGDMVRKLVNDYHARLITGTPLWEFVAAGLNAAVGGKDRWTCQMRCVAKRAMPQRDSECDTLYSFANIDSDGTLTQIIEDANYCAVGDVIRLALTRRVM